MCVCLLLQSVGLSRAAGTNAAPAVDQGFAHLSLSPAGDRLLFDLLEQPGLYLADLATGATETIALGYGVAYRASWSEDSRHVGFKRFIGRLQVASVYDVMNRTLRDLCEPSAQVGIPAFSADGRISFTIDRTLYLVDLQGRVLRTFPLPAYCNQTPISPDGSRAAFTDQDDQLHVLTMADGRIRRLSTDAVGCFAPQWSPNNRTLLAHSIDGRVLIFDSSSGCVKDLGPGLHAIWDKQGEWITFTRITLSSEGRVVRQGLYSMRCDGSEGFYLTRGDHDYAACSAGQWIFKDGVDGQLRKITGSPALISRCDRMDLPAAFRPAAPLQSEMPAAGPSAVSFAIPYLHQAYDSPDWFNGNSACGAASAVMCLAYYGVLPKWTVTCSRPYPHTSDYGRYICEKYTINGFTFDIGGQDPDGVIGYGGYGYIIRNNWQNTKEYMAEYARLHGVNSNVDWFPSRAKLQNEIRAKMPVVILNSLTSSGHYVAAVGYDQEATSVVCNDPWGNKNYAYPSFLGAGAIYDWPGFNNGHAGLEIVHCFIYFRSQRSNLRVQGLAKADTLRVNESSAVSVTISNTGMIASDECPLRLVLSTNAYYDSTDLRLAECTAPALAVADTYRVQLDFVLPDTLLSAVYALGVQVDADGDNLELSETDNFQYTRLTVIGRPKLYGMTPAENSVIAEPRPLISCFHLDKISPVDPEQVSIALDGRDVSEQAERQEAFTTYHPAEPLQAGEHTVFVRAVNQAGFANERSWRFTLSPQTGVLADQTPTSSFLFAAYPNPFNLQATIRVQLPQPETAAVEIYSLTGARVKTLYRGVLAQGQFYWNGTDESGGTTAGGLYLCRLLTPGRRHTIRLLLVK